jgi:hypothetical protein
LLLLALLLLLLFAFAFAPLPLEGVCLLLTSTWGCAALLAQAFRLKRRPSGWELLSQRDGGALGAFCCISAQEAP